MLVKWAVETSLNFTMSKYSAETIFRQVMISCIEYNIDYSSWKNRNYRVLTIRH